MKLQYFLYFVLLIGELVLAQMNHVKLRHVHHHHAERDIATISETMYDPHVIIYLNQQGETLTVVTQNGAIPTLMENFCVVPSPASAPALQSFSNAAVDPIATPLAYESPPVPDGLGAVYSASELAYSAPPVYTPYPVYSAPEPAYSVPTPVYSAPQVYSASPVYSIPPVYTVPEPAYSVSTSVYSAPVYSAPEPVDSAIPVYPASESSYSAAEPAYSTLTSEIVYSDSPSNIESLPTVSASAVDAVSTQTSSGSGGGYGITYSPYRADGNCKTQDEVNADFVSFTGYGLVRTYGTDCNQLETVSSAALSKGMKLMLGIFDLTNLDQDVQNIISIFSNKWSGIDTVSVCNECVNSGRYSVGDVVNAVNSVRSRLQGAGFPGSVVAVDTFIAMVNYPEICTASDYCATNCHAFFDGGVEASKAGDFVFEQAQRVSNAAGGKRTVVVESGWPSAGDTNGLAVPSEANQEAAIISLRNVFATDIYLFTAYNDLWKEPGLYGVEQHWGILGTSTS